MNRIHCSLPVAGLLLVLALPAPASAARKPCEELRVEIDAGLQAKGVTRYTLEIVAPDAVGEARVVGSCEGGTRRIVYKRT